MNYISAPSTTLYCLPKCLIFITIHNKTMFFLGRNYMQKYLYIYRQLVMYSQSCEYCFKNCEPVL